MRTPRKYTFVRVHRLSSGRFVHGMVTGVSSSARVTVRIPTAGKGIPSLSASLVSGSAIPHSRGWEWQA